MRTSTASIVVILLLNLVPPPQEPWPFDTNLLRSVSQVFTPTFDDLRSHRRVNASCGFVTGDSSAAWTFVGIRNRWLTRWSSTKGSSRTRLRCSSSSQLQHKLRGKGQHDAAGREYESDGCHEESFPTTVRRSIRHRTDAKYSGEQPDCHVHDRGFSNNAKEAPSSEDDVQRGHEEQRGTRTRES